MNNQERAREISLIAFLRNRIKDVSHEMLRARSNGNDRTYRDLAEDLKELSEACYAAELQYDRATR